MSPCAMRCYVRRREGTHDASHSSYCYILICKSDVHILDGFRLCPLGMSDALHAPFECCFAAPTATSKVLMWFQSSVA